MSSREIRHASPANNRAVLQVATKAASDRARTTCPLCELESKPVFRLSHTTIYECRDPRCRLQFASPQLDDEELGRAYAALYYPAEDGGRVVLENATDFEVRKFLSAIENHVGSLRGARVLDFGCGNGVLLRIVSEMGTEAVGIEQSETAREHVANSGYGRAYADLGELKKMQPSAEFDFIMMCDAVEHLREPWVDLAGLRSVLAPRGRLFMTTPNTKSLRSRLSGASWDQRYNPTHFYYFHSQSLTKVVRRAGFGNVVELRPITEYRHHGLMRRALQHGLARFGLHGGLLFMASH